MDASAPSPLSVDVRELADGGTLISISGEVDCFALPTVRRAVGRCTPPAPAVTVDLSEVTFIDAAGIEYLLELSEAARAHGAAFRLGRPSPRVQRVIDLLGVHDALSAPALRPSGE